MGRVLRVVVAALVLSTPSFAAVRSSSPEIRNATPEQERQIREALSRVPECLRNCGGKGGPETPIVVTPANIPTQAGWDTGANRMVIDQLALDSADSRAGADQLADLFCGTRGSEAYSTNTDALTRTLVHEYAHKQHLSCGPKAQAAVKKLADQRYFDKRKALRADPEYQPTVDAQIALLTQASDAWDAAHPGAAPPATVNEQITRINAGMTDAMRARNCELRKKTTELYRRHGLPVRFEGDDHAADPDKSDLDEGGEEYFAMLVETAVYDGAAFCKAAEPEEIAYLRETYGSCLGKLGKKKPECWDDAAPKKSTIPPRGKIEFLHP